MIWAFVEFWVACGIFSWMSVLLRVLIQQRIGVPWFNAAYLFVVCLIFGPLGLFYCWSDRRIR